MADDTHEPPRAPIAVSITRSTLIAGLVLAGCTEVETDDASPTTFRSLDDGLLLYWTFEDSVGSQILDVSGNGRHGTLQGGAALVASPDGQAVSLDGVDDYLSLVGPRSPALYGGADGSFTISARVRVGDVVRYNTLCYGCGPFTAMYVGTSDYGPVVLSALDDQASAGKKWPKSAANLQADAWTQITMVIENGTSARYYLDCAAAGQLDDPNIGLEDTGYSSVGQGSPGRWFEGEIDELRVWDRALTGSELDQLCPAGDPLAQDLELHWDFEEPDDDVIPDLSGNGRVGTVKGGATFVPSPFGQALNFYGTNDWVSFVGPRAPSIYGGAQGDFTISARIRVDDVNRYNTLCFGCGPFTTMYVGDPGPGGRTVTNLYNLDTQQNLWTSSSSSLVNDTWAEVTLVVEGGEAARYYHDCQPNGSLEGVNVGLRDPGYSAIGQGANPNLWFEGDIDELRIWSRALSQAELDLVCGWQGLCGGPIHVDVDAPPGGDGMTWATAFDTVQGAIDAAAICDAPELWIAEGQYATATNGKVADIQRPIEIYGGFDGTETLRSQRDVDAHPVRFGADGWTYYVVRIEIGPEPGVSGPVRLDGVTISGVVADNRRAIDVRSGGFGTGLVTLANLTLTDNLGGAIGAFTNVEIINSTFERNYAESGGAIFVRWSNLTVIDSSFVDNHADEFTGLGGAIFFVEVGRSHQISGTEFRDNSAYWGGAIHVNDTIASDTLTELSVVDSEFVNNSTTGGGGGAVYAEESNCQFEGVAFVDNAAKFGGAVYWADISAADQATLEFESCRFIGNQALNGSGGALRLLEQGTSVVNSEFVGNTATTVGGGVYGRGAFVSTTFTGNTAPNAGSGLYALAGADMTMDHCVAYPDTIVGANIYAPHSCVSSAVLGSPVTQLGGVDPFAPADLDLDGRTEFYLDPDGPCTGLDGGVIDEFDWTSLTVDPSQCTDAGWPEPGVHYTPQAAVGACE